MISFVGVILVLWGMTTALKLSFNLRRDEGVLTGKKNREIKIGPVQKRKGMNPEELKIVEDEKQTILNDILDELQTQSLRGLFYDTVKKKLGWKKLNLSWKKNMKN